MESAKEIYVLGIGRNTPVFIEIALDCGYSISGLYHYASNRTGELDHGYEIIGSFDNLFAADSLEGKNFLLTMGDITIRKQLFERITAMGGNIPTLIHPTSVVSRFATISPRGVIIAALTDVQADCIIEDNVVLLQHVCITHSSTIRANSFIAIGAIIGAYTDVGEEVFMGLGVVTISGKVSNVGNRAFIGAGSLVTKDVKAHTTIMGNPAYEYKKNLR